MMILRNLHIIGQEGSKEISISNQSINSIEPAGTSAGASIEFEDAIALPGLINSHDHLDFDLFPQIGNRIYNNYTEWGADIHANNKAQINEVLQIPQALRIQWGLYKNLLAGVTTVVNHGNKLSIPSPAITVLQDFNILHSVGFEKNWKWKLSNPISRKETVVTHIGEGTDDYSAKEIDELIKWNLFKRYIIGVHGVAMNAGQAKSFKGIVWCPVSNFFLLNKTAAINELQETSTIVFGTDSTLTAGWNIWDHLRTARNLQLVSDTTLLEMVTVSAARLWNINAGELAAGKDADIIIAKKKNSLFDLNPEDILLVIRKGAIKLFDKSLSTQVGKDQQEKFSSVYINGIEKMVAGDLPSLIKEIKKYHPGALVPITVL